MGLHYRNAAKSPLNPLVHGRPDVARFWHCVHGHWPRSEPSFMRTRPLLPCNQATSLLAHSAGHRLRRLAACGTLAGLLLTACGGGGGGGGSTDTVGDSQSGSSGTTSSVPFPIGMALASP